MNRQMSVLTAIAVLAAGLLGCGDEGGALPLPTAEDPWLADIAGPSYALEVEDVTLTGAINDRRISAWVTGDGFHDPGFTSVSSRVEAVDPDQVFMTLLYFEGGLNHPEVVPGAVFEHSSEPVFDDGLYVFVVGCQGLVSDAAFQFDAPASAATIEIGPRTNESVVEVIYEATFESETGALDTVTGSALVERPGL